ncbi:UEV-domain-containing protein [Ceraceosorus guamensis]|uniref:UEV-domain-containing protein n=1 Tax=Ceraceosorus guamensis TaxID=1522189 RepID=A0A316VRR9_9BASI|nr:UEV-domain-containing protein [Ceraceosorus guamensis]PWN40349.1 UEV-domain-containing protein [Ceraceosorus guamensis]
MDQDVVRRWLRQVSSLYPNASRIYTDVDALLLHQPSLRPSTSEYISDVGQASLLLNLKGTIPILFKGQTYHIPLIIWIPRAYPREAPLVFVTPTRDMLVRKGEHVDLSGKTSGEWLSMWEKKWEACNLVNMVQSLQQQFGQMPPVYARPASEAHQASRSGTGTALESGEASSSRNSPSTSDFFRSSPAPYASPATTIAASSSASGSREESRAPARPPKPDADSGYASRDPASFVSATGTTQSHRWSASYAPQTQLPARPNVTSPLSTNRPASFHASDAAPPSFSPAHPYSSPRAHPRPHEHISSTGAPPHPSSTGPAQQADGRRASSGREIPASHAHFSPSYHHPAQSAAEAARIGPYDAGQQSQAHHAYQQAQQGRADSTGSSAPPPLPPHAPHQYGTPGAGRGDTLKQPNADSYVAAGANGVAPPLPPNPELLSLRQALHSKLSLHITTELNNSLQRKAQLEMLLADLQRGAPAIHDEMERLRAVRDVVRSTLSGLQESRDRTVARTLEVEKRPAVHEEEIVCATSIVGNQLLNLTADDNAIEDTLYHLGRALGAGTEQLDLDKYLKQTRFLAREQFFKRALAGRICTSMGWE